MVRENHQKDHLLSQCYQIQHAKAIQRHGQMLNKINTRVNLTSVRQMNS